MILSEEHFDGNKYPLAKKMWSFIVLMHLKVLLAWKNIRAVLADKQKYITLCMQLVVNMHNYQSSISEGLCRSDAN